MALGYSDYRLSCDKLGFVSFADVLDSYVDADSKTAIKPDFIILSLGSNDLSSSNMEFDAKLNSVLNDLEWLYPNTPIYLVKPMNGAKISLLKVASESFETITIVDTDSWTTRNDTERSEYLVKVLLDKCGEDIFFKGTYTGDENANGNGGIVELN